jgi:fructoselysine-6-P-deglycase FrlB-like protein
MSHASSTLASIAGSLPTYLSSSDAWANDVMAAIEGRLRSNRLYFLARGAQLGSAWQSSMLFAETARQSSAMADWATFRHGFEPQVDAGFVGIGFESPKGHGQANRAPDVVKSVASSIAHRRGTIHMVPQLDDAGGDAYRTLGTEYWRPLWETLPVHQLCMRLATAKGLDAGEIERKVTEDYA